MKAIGVFGAASDAIDPLYKDEARAAGRAIGAAGYGLVFGAGATGLMAAVARGAREAGAAVCGVVPEHLCTPGVIDGACDELLVTRDLRARMAAMAERSSGFLALPGGLGTLYEVAEILVLLQLLQIDKPLVLLNTLGFYDAFAGMTEGFILRGFAAPEVRGLFDVVDAPDRAVSALFCRLP